MKLSSKSHYGLKACFILASIYPAGTISASGLEKEIGVSAKYIEKIMRILSNRKIISASRGACGGYFLTKEPSEITIGEIVRALEDDFELTPCVNSACSKCPSSAVWKKLYDGINSVLDGITLQSSIDDFSNLEVCDCNAISGKISENDCNCNIKTCDNCENCSNIK